MAYHQYEEVYLKNYANPKEARRSLTAYLDFYNHRRWHQALDYQTPASMYFMPSSVAEVPHTQSQATGEPL